MGFQIMLKNALLISLLSFGSFVHLNSCSNPTVENSNYQVVPKQDQATPEPQEPVEPESASAAFVTITDLNKQKPEKGTFETKGFIAKVYRCPPCPPDAECKPCMKDNIVISEEKKILEGYDVGPTELILFTNDPKEYSLGDVYEFEIRITKNRTTMGSINDIEIVGSRRLR